MSMEPIEEGYFNWLYEQVAHQARPTPSQRFYRLFQILHQTEFVWNVIGDDNRAQDGVDLRSEYLRVSFLPHDTEWPPVGCSILEMLVAFCRRAEFETDILARDWFWTLLRNLGLNEFNDAWEFPANEVSEILERFVWRLYSRRGEGGLFPLHHANEDQRHVEIWYQFYAYLQENEIV